MFTNKDVCAVIVTYNCDTKVIDSIKTLKSQVEKIVIIDNLSSENSMEILKFLDKDAKIYTIYNSENRGLGYALNQGLSFAHKSGFKLILTMDQDTILCENAVQNMIEVLNNNSDIASVGPSYKELGDISTGLKYKKVQYLITSGNLSRIDNVIAIGGYNNKLFVDSVDFDFSLSIRDCGKSIAIVYDAHMIHKIGEKEDAKFFFINFKIYTHSPNRYYFIYRNHVYILKKYFLRHPVFCIKKQMSLLFDFFKILLVENKKRDKILMAIKGIKDAFRNKYEDIDFERI